MEMSNAQRMQFINHVALLIFSVPLSDSVTLFNDMKNIFTGAEWSPWVIGGQIAGRTFKDSSTGLGTLRGFDISLDIGMKNPNGTVKLLNLRFLEQNPNKTNAQGNLKENAILARAGNKIMWVIQNGIQNGFLGKLQNGEWIPSRPRAYIATTGPIGIDQYGENAQLNEGDWSSVPTIPPQGIDNSITALMESESLDGECEWSGI
jgi:hypothetical protein